MLFKKSTKEKVQSAQEPKPRLAWKERLRSRPVLGGACIAAALLLSFVVTPLVQMGIAKTTQVVVLAQSVPAGTQITPDLLDTKEMGQLNLPQGVLSSPEEAVGQYLTVSAAQGDLLTAGRLSPQIPSDDPQLAQLPSGKLAISVTLNDLASSVSGKLRAGDVIRLYAVLEQGDPNAADYAAMSVPELQYVEVLAVTNGVAADVRSKYEGQGETTDSERQIATVTLAVDGRQAAVLAGLEQNAALHAALVVRGSQQAKEQALQLQAEYLASAQEGAVQEEVVTP